MISIVLGVWLSASVVASFMLAKAIAIRDSRH